MIELPDESFIVLPEMYSTVERLFHDAGECIGHSTSFLIQEHGQTIEFAIISIGDNKLM